MDGPIEIIAADAALAAPSPSPRAVVIARDYAATPAQIWPLFTSTEGITSWLVDSARIELRLGGAYELHFMAEAAEGTRGSEGCRVLSFVPERMLSFTWNAPPMFPQRSQHTWVVLELDPSWQGTHLRLTHLGWPEAGFTDGSEWPEIFAYFERAWSGVFDALAAKLRPPSD